MNTNLVKIDKSGNVTAGNVTIDFNKFLNSLNNKVEMHIGAVSPTEFKLGDFWYDPVDDSVSMARIVGEMVTWVELPFGLAKATGSSGGSGGGVTVEQLNAINLSLLNRINMKIDIYTQPTPPSVSKVSLWLDTDDNTMYKAVVENNEYVWIEI